VLFAVWLLLGFILNLAVKGFSPELLIEIPPYRLPSLRGVFTKLWLRTWGFLKEALPIIMGAIFVVSVLYSLGGFDAIANFTAPVVSGIFGLPKEAVVAIIIGFMRKDIAIGMLAPLGLSAGQLVVGCVVLTMFFPCVAAFVVLAKELGFKKLLAAMAIMIVSTIIVGGLLNLVL
jgi:ferrous iron transport protein B